MKLALSDNIRALRKEKGLTQEQLAEVLNVTTGAVHKWEAGLSIPELDMILKLAELFSTSVDALLGYRIQDDRLETIKERISAYCRVMDPEAIPEAEKALLKYPNTFEIVHICAIVYLIYGMADSDKALIRRGKDLMEKTLQLLPQNKDPKISEHTIYKDISMAYYALGEIDKCVDMMKKNNVGGLFNDEIGSILAFEKRADEAEPFLSEGLLLGVSGLVNVATGYAMIFLHRRDFVSARDVLLWGCGLVTGLKRRDEAGYMDKMYVEMLVMLSAAQLRTDGREAAEETVRRALEVAERFDAAPDFGLSDIKFVSGLEKYSNHDAMGATAAEAIKNILGYMGDPEAEALWEEARSPENT